MLKRITKDKRKKTYLIIGSVVLLVGLIVAFIAISHKRHPATTPTFPEDCGAECTSDDYKACSKWTASDTVKSAKVECVNNLYHCVGSDGCTVECKYPGTFPNSVTHTCEASSTCENYMPYKCLLSGDGKTVTNVEKTVNETINPCTNLPVAKTPIGTNQMTKSDMVFPSQCSNIQQGQAGCVGIRTCVSPGYYDSNPGHPNQFKNVECSGGELFDPNDYTCKPSAGQICRKGDFRDCTGFIRQIAASDTAKVPGWDLMDEFGSSVSSATQTCIDDPDKKGQTKWGNCNVQSCYCPQGTADKDCALIPMTIGSAQVPDWIKKGDSKAKPDRSKPYTTYKASIPEMGGKIPKGQICGLMDNNGDYVGLPGTGKPGTITCSDVYSCVVEPNRVKTQQPQLERRSITLGQDPNSKGYYLPSNSQQYCPPPLKPTLLGSPWDNIGGTGSGSFPKTGTQLSKRLGFYQCWKNHDGNASWNSACCFGNVCSPCSHFQT